MDFEKRVAVVTGGASGIGQAMVELLLERGATTYVIDRISRGVPDGGIALQADVSDYDSMSAAIDEILSRGDGIDALFNNAGVLSQESVLTETLEVFDQVMAVNTRGVFIGMKLTLPGMLAAGRGAIVNTASAAGLIGLRERASYSASKGAVIALSRQAAVDYAAQGIRINCICPGTTRTSMFDEMLVAAEDPATLRAQLYDRQPIGRPASPREMAQAAVFLASEEAGYITGVALQVDGGWTAA